MISLNISFYIITPHLIYKLYNRKNPKERCPKMVIYPRRSLATNPMNLEIILQLTLNWFTTLIPVDLHLVFSWLPCALMLASCQLTSLTCCQFLRLRIYSVDLPWPLNFFRFLLLQLYPVDPPRPSTCCQFLRFRLSLQRILYIS